MNSRSVRRQPDQRPGQDPVDRRRGQAADEVADLVGGDDGTSGRTWAAESREDDRIDDAGPARAGPACAVVQSSAGACAWKTLVRSATAASRVVSGARPKRRSMVARIEVVSCSVVVHGERVLQHRRDEQRRDPGARAPLVADAGDRLRRRDVVPLPAELVVGHDDQRAVGVRAVLDRLEQVDEVAAAGVLAGVAGVLVLGADRLDEADRLQAQRSPAAAMNSCSSRRWAARAAVPGA